MLRRIIPLIALVLSLSVASGCVKVKQVVTVMPDGSGKIDLTFGINAELAQHTDQNPFADLTLEKMAGEDLPEGVVAITPPFQREENGFQYIHFTMYFENIAKVQGHEGDLAEVFAGYSFESGDPGCTLTIEQGLILGMLSEYEQPDPDDLQFMGQMFDGMELAEQYILPGAAEPVDGVAMTDNTAEIVITGENLIHGDGPIEALANTDTLTLIVPEITITQAQADAFAAEMTDAIAAWEILKQEMEAEPMDAEPMESEPMEME